MLTKQNGYSADTLESSDQARSVAVILAMYSTTDDTEANERAVSVSQITGKVSRGDMDTVLRLLNDIAPEASVSERKEAADRLVSTLGKSDGELSPEQSIKVANELTRLMTGHGIDADKRVEAAREMVRLSHEGELNVENATKLTDAIAPEWSIEEREEALGYLAWQFTQGEWNANSTKRTAEEGYTLITGGEIQLERRMEAGVELVGEGLKQFGGDSFDDESVDKSTALITGAISGGLSTESVSNILDLDNGKSNGSNSSINHSDLYAEGLEAWENFGHGRIPRRGSPSEGVQAYARTYAQARAAGHWSDFADDYAYLRAIKGRSSTWSYAYAEAEERLRRMEVQPRGLSSENYAEMIELGISKEYASHYFDGAHESLSLVGAHRADTADLAKYKSPYDRIPDGFAKTYAEQMMAGSSSYYAIVYSQEIHHHSKLEECAQVYAEVNVEQRDDGKTWEYANAYADKIDDGKTREYASVYAGAIENGRTVRYANAYVEQIDDGKTDRYADAYAKQIEDGKTPRYARAYTELHIAGMSPALAYFYAWGVGGSVGGLPIMIIGAAIVAAMLVIGAGAYVVNRSESLAARPFPQ